MITIFIAVLAKLFSIVNPFGVVPMYLTMTSHFEVKERHRLVCEQALKAFDEWWATVQSASPKPAIA